MAKTSIVWAHFEDVQNTPGSAKCKICGNIYKRGGGTSNLRDHLKRSHAEVLQDGAILPHTAPRGDSYSDDSPKKASLDKYLVRIFARDYQPFRIVEDDGFVQFIRSLDPRYKMPTRHTISKKFVPAIFEEVEVAVQDNINKAKRVALTIDSWTSQKSDSYLGITAHYVLNDKLKSVCLDCSVLVKNHTGVHIADRITEVMNKWKISTKVTAIVTDNGSNMVTAVRLLNIRHVSCAAHTLNLVVKDALNDTGAVKQIFEKCSAIVTFFKHSNIAQTKLRTKRTENEKKPLSLIAHVVTRWNSLLHMIRRLIELREELVICMSEMPTAPEGLQGGEWLILQEVEAILTPLEEMTKALSSETYVTSSLIIPLVHGLVLELEKLLPVTLTDEASEFLNRIRDSANERLLPYQDRSVARGATFVHPSYKKTAFLSSAKANEAQQQVEHEVRALLLQRTTTAPPADPSTSSASPQGNAPAELRIENPSLLNFMRDRVAGQQRIATSTSSATILVRQYVEVPPELGIDALKFWSNQQSALSEVAGYYLCVPATSVPAERLFSKSGYILSERRNSLSPRKAKMLIFLHANSSFY